MLLDVNPHRCTDEQLPTCVNGTFHFAVLDPSARSDCGAQSVRDEIIALGEDRLAQLSRSCEGEPRQE
jgi:hypothetical protein